MIGLLLKLAPYAIVAAMAVGAYQFAPLVGVNAQRHRLEASRDQWKEAEHHARDIAVAWQTSFLKSEKLRGEENKTAVAAVDATQAQCDLRVVEARRASQAIRKVLNVPVKLDANNCPLRTVLGADSLRDAIGAR